MSTFCPSDPFAIILSPLVHLRASISPPFFWRSKMSVSREKGCIFDHFYEAKKKRACPQSDLEDSAPRSPCQPAAIARKRE